MANSPFPFPKNRRTRWMDENLWENLDLGSSRVCFRTRVKLLEIDARCTRWTRALVRYTCEFIDISWNTAGTAGANQMKPKPDHYSARQKVGGNGETSGKTFLLPPFSCFFPPQLSHPYVRQATVCRASFNPAMVAVVGDGWWWE